MSCCRKSTRPCRPILIIICLLSIFYMETAAAQPGPSQRHGNLEISGAWARATPPAAKTGAVYLTLVNHGGGTERLIAARSPAAAQAELHAQINEAGIMRMTAVDAVVLGPGEHLSLRPGGLHVMLIELTAPLREGAPLALTLSFAGLGDVTVDVPVLRNAPTSREHRH